MTGYLTKADKNEMGETVHLRIPNAEIFSIFEDSVVRHFKRAMDRDVCRTVVFREVRPGERPGENGHCGEG